MSSRQLFKTKYQSSRKQELYPKNSTMNIKLK